MSPPPLTPPASSWFRSAFRAELLALYTEADAILAGWTCSCSPGPTATAAPEVPCCHFAVTGREPYPTAVELEEVRYAMRAAGVVMRDRRRLPVSNRPHRPDLRPCPLLSGEGRCRIYASRPLGCRTFFCKGAAEAPYGSQAKAPRDAVNAIGRRIADLSARFAPRDPQPRALTKSIG
jgi:Fe-S-cluster containining protein